MIYTVKTYIEVQQVTPFTASTGEVIARNDVVQIPFLNEYDCSSTWVNLTSTLNVILAKNAKYKLQNGGIAVLGNIEGQKSNLGGFDSVPVFMRGDILTMYAGYYGKLNGDDYTEMNVIFKGFISSVNPKLPFTLQCEDAMWLCKQIPTPARAWGTKTIQQIVKDILDLNTSLELLNRYKPYGIELTTSNNNAEQILFNVDSLQTTRGSLAMFLDRMKGQYKVDSYFRDNELRVGLTHYVAADNVDHEFTFQKNIISDRLEWRRRDDMQMSVIVKSHYSVAKSGTTVDGHAKTKAATTEVLVFSHKTATTDGFDYVVKKKGQAFKDNEIGERYTLNVDSPITDVKKLFEMGKAYLKKHYYDGFKGTFTTFGIPYVKHGDTVHIVDAVLKERTGYYKVKAVNYRGGYDIGLRQDITLDYKIDG